MGLTMFIKKPAYKLEVWGLKEVNIRRKGRSN